ncbi:geranyl transferase [Virgibacillus phasianinus]|uniref:Farnesyl diphosphate synthase n=1 Tax=Virgibacillus phasianinus TaxID=2017483 RepID=A0A220U5J0_9BACI|nr:farnesyl diphosphate synthase [Virgibacillus phasianinus]ASK63242.1 geranyl transferase [Virgibacillus phasianinus]
MQSSLTSFIEDNKQFIQQELHSALYQLDIPATLKESMIYSIEVGGKKLRPILLIASYGAYGDDKSSVIAPAIALEMIHTYSLIHDDLPAMDDDSIRRGKPTNHIAFDEATAILAGDALLTFSFEVLACDRHLTDNQKVFLINELSKASGPKGMVAGQLLDIEAENKELTLEQLERVHALKTGELIKFAIKAGAYVGNASTEQLDHLDEFAYYLGLIFQVQDDILDVMGDEEKIGKPVGSDEGNNKSTYPKLLGNKGAIKQKEKYVKLAKDALFQAGADQSFLMSLTDYFSTRDH